MYVHNHLKPETEKEREMAGAQALVAIAVAYIVMIMSSGYFQSVEGWKVDEEKGWKGEELKFIHVGGKVMCQDCTQGWNQWTHGAKPIKGIYILNFLCFSSKKIKKIFA